MFQKFREYFTYSASERNALLVILALIVIVVTLIYTFDYLSHDEDQFEQLDLSALMATPDANEVPEEAEKTVALFPFDPNQLPVEGWVRLGFSEKQAASIVKYRSKAGDFRQPDDLLKLFVIDSAKFRELKPFIQIKSGNGAREDPTGHPARININSCTITDLMKLSGIGKHRAKKIIGFRDALGGFSSINQIGETYDLPPDVFAKIKGALVVEPDSWAKLNINSLDSLTLSAHPYISGKVAESIVFFREKVGPFKTNKDLVHMDLISLNLYVKLQPYLTPIE